MSTRGKSLQTWGCGMHPVLCLAFTQQCASDSVSYLMAQLSALEFQHVLRAHTGCVAKALTDAHVCRPPSLLGLPGVLHHILQRAEIPVQSVFRICITV